MPAIATHSRLATPRSTAPAIVAGALRTSAAEDTATFDRVGTVISMRRDQVLCFEGDPARYCFKVVRGAMRGCRLLPDGRRHVMQFLLPGDLVAFDSQESYRATVEAVNDATVIRYPRHAVDQLVQRHPRLGRSLLGKLCADLCAAHVQMLLLGRKNALERLASFLLAMSERNDEDDRIELPMTRSDIADHLGLTMETVSRSFTQLKACGVIELKASSEVLIRRREALQDIADAA